MHRPYSCCPHCGAPLPAEQPWPRACLGCGRTCYLSPAPVGVVLQPVHTGGVVLVQRDIPPGRGQWALPGGFLDSHEAWRHGCARELREETGIHTDPEALVLVELLDAVADNLLLLIALAPPLDEAALPPFVRNTECADRRIARAPEPLAFPLHTQAMARFFAA